MRRPEMNDPNTESAEILLEPPLASTLQTGLARLPTPALQTRFNQQVLNLLTSEREFDAWPQQALLRLRWMLIPTILGFVLTLVLAIRMCRPIPMPEERPHLSSSLTAPALPPLPDMQPARNRPVPV